MAFISYKYMNTLVLVRVNVNKTFHKQQIVFFARLLDRLAAHSTLHKFNIQHKTNFPSDCFMCDITLCWTSQITNLLYL